MRGRDRLSEREHEGERQTVRVRAVGGGGETDC